MPSIDSATTAPPGNRQRGKPDVWTALFRVLFPLGLVGMLALTVFYVVPRLYTVWYGWWQLNQVGVATEGTVLERRIVVGEESTRYIIFYEYDALPADGDPRRQTGQAAVNASDYEELVEGAPVTVYYVPAEPTISALRISSFPPIFYTLLLVAGTAMITGWLLIMTHLVWKRYDRPRRA
jgi:hypothetical protein